MSRESRQRIDNYAELLINGTDGSPKRAIDNMVADGMTYQGILDFCRSINFYPDDELNTYAHNLTAHKKNKEALDGFFAKTI